LLPYDEKQPRGVVRCQLLLAQWYKVAPSCCNVRADSLNL